MSFKCNKKENIEEDKYRVVGEFPSGTSFCDTLTFKELINYIKRKDYIISVNGYKWKNIF